MQDFKKLQVWQKAHSLTLGVDRASKRIRGSQYASLRNQIFRAAASIPANIAEGRRQKSQKDFGRFLSIALNSSSELEYHLILARDTNQHAGERVSLSRGSDNYRQENALRVDQARRGSGSVARNRRRTPPKPQATYRSAESRDPNSKPPAAPPKAAGR
jgi:four helix bundle protein